VPARFYVPDASMPGQLADLPDEEAQHLSRVLRLHAGDAVRVFNGRGAEFAGVVEDVTKSSAAVRVGDAVAAAAEPAVAITVAHAVLKADKMDDVIRDAVMMGAAAIQPLLTVRTEVTRGALERGHRLERWARIAISSAKQCGRAVVPPVLPPCDIPALMGALSALTLPGPALMFVEPGAADGALRFSDVDAVPPREATVIVGPEGGWAPQELEAAATACRLVTLQGPTLRADAMAIVALSALFARWQQF
jgi:16S rRNA (uracil1498-N3)-methyltransferase